MYRKMKIVVIASGLGIVQRGFETSALTWSRSFRASNQAEVLLLSGGHHVESHRLPCISQRGYVAECFRKVGMLNDGARLQQRTFTPFAKRAILKFSPDFVWLQEGNIAESLQTWVRRKLPQCQIVFCNGAPLGASFCSQFDLVIDLIPRARQLLIDIGYPESRSTTIPHPIVLPEPDQSRNNWRAENGYSPSDFVAICVAAWDSHHKRIDYVLREVADARRSCGNLKLLLCGQPSNQSSSLQTMGRELLGEHVRWLTLTQEELASAYQGADLFVLASKDEAFGAVIAEAAIAGLPILCNDFPAARFILGERYPGIIDMVHEGGLSNALQSDALIRDLPLIPSETKERFSADLLTKDLELFLRSHLR